MKQLVSRFVFAPVFMLVFAAAAIAQDGGTAVASRAAVVPFGLGERMTYNVRLGIVGQVGTGSMEIDTVTHTIRGNEVYAMRFRLQGGIAFAKVDDDFISWMDTQDLFSHRFKQDQKEVKYERHRTIDFFPAERRWRTLDGDDSGTMPTDRPLDDVTFLYFVRTLPLEVGKTYTFNRYFKEDGNPVTVKVLRKQRITVPAGTYNTIVVQPIIKTKGLFSEGGQAELYFTDDDRRILVQLKSKVKILRSLDLQLTGYNPGIKLAR